jgi:hypothetical protein
MQAAVERHAPEHGAGIAILVGCRRGGYESPQEAMERRPGLVDAAREHDVDEALHDQLAATTGRRPMAAPTSLARERAIALTARARCG